MKKLIFPTIITFSLLFCLPSLAATVYVDGDNGNDILSAGSEASPYRTLTMALANISRGDTIYCKGTIVDNPTVHILHSGSEGALTSIMNWPDETCTIDGGGAGNTNALVIDAASYIKIEGLNITNANKYGIFSNGTNLEINNNNIYDMVDITGVNLYSMGNNCTISGNNIYNTNNSTYYGMYVSTASDTIVEKNNVHNFIRFGIGAEFSAGTLTVKNNFIYDIGGNTNGYAYPSGIIFLNTPTSLIYNNTFYNIADNNFNAIRIMDSSGVAIKNNIISACYKGLSINAGGMANLDSNNNLFHEVDYIGDWAGTNYTELSTWQVATSQDPDSITGDPLFNSTTSGAEDLHLTDTSPAIDTGLDIGSITGDIDNEDRPYYVTDIGADERPVIEEVPTNLAYSPKPKKIEYSWDMDQDYPVTNFIVRSATKSDFSDATTNLFDDSGAGLVENLKPAKKYYTQAQAVFTTDAGTYSSDWSDSLISGTKPKKIKKLKNLMTGHTYSQWRWKKYKRVRNYNIKLMNKNKKKIKTIKISKKKKFVKNTKKKFVKKMIEDLKIGKTYKLKIRGKKKINGEWLKGKWSKTKTFTTQADAAPY
ncbi:MAG: right-handed parallel beta-helix repeat-containing protein [Patescibacteria group bacterium]